MAQPEPGQGRSASERSDAAAKYVPTQRQREGSTWDAQLRLRRWRRNRHIRWEQLAAFAIRVQRADERSHDSVWHRHGGLAYHLPGDRALLRASRMGDGHLRPSREFAVRRADVEGLSGPSR